MDKKIGIFDSGVGGLTVLKELKKICPNESFVYVGDTKNLPYGNKSKEELIQITSNIFNFYNLRDVKAVIMACNTTSAVVWEEIKNKFNFPIYPISQTVCKYFNQLDIKKIGIFATSATVNSQVYQKTLNAKTYAIAPVEWVDIVESNSYKTPQAQENIKKYALDMQKFEPEKIILGCTHYPYLTDELIQYFDKNQLINPAKIFAQAIHDNLDYKNLLSPIKHSDDEFYVTDAPEQFLTNAQKFYVPTSKPQLIEM